MSPKKLRCINIDWLEVYAKESFEKWPVDAQFFRDHGFLVMEREYGTRQYKEMFTILDKDDRPFIEIRRNPVASNDDDRVKGIFDPQSCHVRMSNRWCYADNAIRLFSDFLLEYGYTVQRLYRLDLAMDFEKFDMNDDPQEVIKRYLKGHYVKINQGNVSAHGKDMWAVRCWNSLTWGAPTSMVSTKLYNKTLELAESKDKPYIRYAWFKAGLVDDFSNMTKVDKDGTIYHPTIWRVEFSIRSTARGWYSYEDCNGNHVRVLRKEHSLATYEKKEDQLKAFAFLAHHYFHFKHYQEGVRKDRCKDKVLFDFALHDVYKLDRLLTDKPKEKSFEALAKRLRNYKITQTNEDIQKACDVLLRSLESMKVRDSLTNFYNYSEATLLQQLIARRMRIVEPLTESLTQVESLLKISNDLFL